MGNEKQQAEYRGRFFTRPWVGTVFTVLSALSFLFLGMILPLVGRAGANRPYSHENFMAFLGVLLVSLLLALLAVFSKMQRRKVDKSPLPYGSFGLVAVCLFLLLALFTGLLRV